MYVAFDQRRDEQLTLPVEVSDGNRMAAGWPTIADAIVNNQQVFIFTAVRADITQPECHWNLITVGTRPAAR
jgi:hypothetical protein